MKITTVFNFLTGKTGGVPNWVLVALALFWLAVLGIAAAPPEPSKTATGQAPRSRPAISDTEARVACWNAVKGSLTNPHTAKFGLFAPELKGGEWHSVGTVTSQNNFGASLKSTFFCRTNAITGKTQSRVQ